MNFENISIGIGKTIVEFFSEEMVARVCRYLARAKEIMIAQSHGWQTRNKKDKSSETSLYPYMNSCELYCVQTWAGEQQGTRRWCLKPLWELATLSALLQRRSPASQQDVNSWIEWVGCKQSPLPSPPWWLRPQLPWLSASSVASAHPSPGQGQQLHWIFYHQSRFIH